MHEYIDRDYIIREACGEICGCEPSECGYDEPCEIVKRYNNWPSADVKEVVLCKFCKLHEHCYTEDVFVFSGINEDNRFCSAGKLQTNSDETSSE